MFKDPGVGNDERIPLDTDNFIDLDGFNGGKLTALHGPVNGYSWAFKQSRIYKLIRTGNRARAYDAIAISKTRGAIEGSVVEGVDQAGRPALYCLDPAVGPCRVGAGGVKTCGSDILTTWRETVNLDATVVCRSVYYPDARQVHWFVATGQSDTPNHRIVLQVNETRDELDGIHKGITLWDGPSAEALAVTLYAENVDDVMITRSQIGASVSSHSLVSRMIRLSSGKPTQEIPTTTHHIEHASSPSPTRLLARHERSYQWGSSTRLRSRTLLWSARPTQGTTLTVACYSRPQQRQPHHESCCI